MKISAPLRVSCFAAIVSLFLASLVARPGDADTNAGKPPADANSSAVKASKTLPKYDTFTTKAGKTYKDVEVIGVAPDGVTVKSADGVVKLFFSGLPEDIQKKYGYDPKKAEEFRKGLSEDRDEFWKEWKRDRKRYWSDVKQESQDRKKKKD